MKVLLLGTLLLFLLSPSRILAQSDSTTVDDLTWISGCWSLEQNDRIFSEQWMHPAGQTLLGMSRTVSQGKTVGYEFLQIRLNQAGMIEFVALPSGQQETSFTLKEKSETGVIFENASHDFPQRIIYRAKGEDSLYARIEGVVDGTIRGIDFPMRRIHCP